MFPYLLSFIFYFGEAEKIFLIIFFLEHLLYFNWIAYFQLLELENFTLFCLLCKATPFLKKIVEKEKVKV